MLVGTVSLVRLSLIIGTGFLATGFHLLQLSFENLKPAVTKAQGKMCLSLRWSFRKIINKVPPCLIEKAI